MRSPASCPAPNAASASAPRFASLSTITGMSSRRRISVAAVMPIQPGRIALEATVPALCSIGPGRPIPAPITALRGTPASASASDTISAASSSPCWASWSVSSGSRRSERIVLARSETATRRCEWSKSMPIAAPAEASKESRIGGRPPCWPCADPGSGGSTTRPSACRSATRLETVERLSPVRRAISAREIVPSSRSAWITRRRLRRLRDSREPARPCGMDGRHWTGCGQVCQCFERTTPIRPVTDAVSGVVGNRHYDVVGGLVMPALLLLVPEHPEPAQEDRDRADRLDDLPYECAAVANRAALVEVVDADAQRHLADGLAARGTFQQHAVDPRDQRGDPLTGSVVVLEDDVDDDGVGDREHEPVDEHGGEAAPEARARTART